MKNNVVSKSEGLVFGVAILSGALNSILGAGGGILLTFAMGKLLSHRFADRRTVLATTQAAMIPGCILSCTIYSSNASLDTKNFAVFAIPALLGGAIGGLLLNKIDAKWINGIFSILLIWSGLRMIVR